MREYLNLLDDVLQNGAQKTDRTGTGTLSVFGRQARFDLTQGFPLLTTKTIHWKSVVHELLWFLRGDSNIAYLQKNGVSIWDDWAGDDGELGPVYGKQWRRWATANGDGVDQIKNVVRGIKQNPDSRRHIVSAWNVGELCKMKLAPCHLLFQFYVVDKKLSCQLYQRSADLFLGAPFNIASYSLLTLMVAHVCGLQAAEFVHTFGDLHLYNNHLSQAREQLSRQPLPPPTVELNPRIDDIDGFRFDDIILQNYRARAKIPAPVAV